jgi:hypothetical protein
MKTRVIKCKNKYLPQAKDMWFDDWFTIEGYEYDTLQEAVEKATKYEEKVKQEKQEKKAVVWKNC